MKTPEIPWCLLYQVGFWAFSCRNDKNAGVMFLLKRRKEISIWKGCGSTDDSKLGQKIGIQAAQILNIHM